MRSKKNFTEAETASAARSVIQAASASKTPSEAPEESTGKRKYNIYNPADPVPEKYTFTCRLPGEIGRYLKVRAHMEWKSTMQLVREIIEADMQQHPEVLEEIERREES